MPLAGACCSHRPLRGHAGARAQRMETLPGADEAASQPHRKRPSLVELCVARGEGRSIVRRALHSVSFVLLRLLNAYSVPPIFNAFRTGMLRNVIPQVGRPPTRRFLLLSHVQKGLQEQHATPSSSPRLRRALAVEPARLLRCLWRRRATGHIQCHHQAAGQRSAVRGQPQPVEHAHVWLLLHHAGRVQRQRGAAAWASLAPGMLSRRSSPGVGLGYA
jgi:hypothetical protein